MNRDGSAPRGRDRVVFVTQAYAAAETLLGVTADWVRVLGTRFAGVDVIAQRAPGAPLLLPRAVTGLRIASMGKDRGMGRPMQSGAFVASLARAAPRARAIFIHMVPRYALLAVPVARLTGTPIVLWYAHGTAGMALRLAMPFVDRVVTPTRDSFPLTGAGVDAKVRVTGHGIDVQRHAPDASPAERGLVLSAGRLSAVKRHELAIDAVLGGPDWSRLVIAGSPLHSVDVAYRQRLVEMIDAGRAVKSPERETLTPNPSPGGRGEQGLAPAPPRGTPSPPSPLPEGEGSDLRPTPTRPRAGEVGRVALVGDVPFAEMPSIYRRAWVMAHASRTGSLDKVVLEAAACGTPVVSSAPSSRAVLGDVPELSVPDGDDEAFVARVRDALGWSTERRAVAGAALRAAVVAGHSLDHWADRVVTTIREVE